ncbi:MAG TPA: hypothetical protein VLG37_05335 [Candidatus Saccharimonadales bacterium]|nr:hypothetical protein [Candidatus Saccharimonadales bacterium]
MGIETRDHTDTVIDPEVASFWNTYFTEHGLPQKWDTYGSLDRVVQVDKTVAVLTERGMSLEDAKSLELVTRLAVEEGIRGGIDG